MSESVILALLIAIPVTITAIGPLILGIMANRKVDVVTIKTDTIINKTDEIHTLTNANLAKVTAALEVANSKIVNLEKLISGLTVQTLERRENK